MGTTSDMASAFHRSGILVVGLLTIREHWGCELGIQPDIAHWRSNSPRSNLR